MLQYYLSKILCLFYKLESIPFFNFVTHQIQIQFLVEKQKNREKMRWKSDLSQKLKHTKNQQYISKTVDIFQLNHGYIYIHFFQKKQNRTKFLKLQALQQLISTCIHPPHPSPQKQFGKKYKILHHWTNFWDIFNYVDQTLGQFF